MEQERAKKPAHDNTVGVGQQVLTGMEETMGYDICLLEDPRHEVFCREYACHNNATKAYMKAFPGCSYNAARVGGCRLLAEPNIQKRIDEIQVERMGRLEITHEKVLRELAKVAFVDRRDFYNEDGTLRGIHDIDPDAVAVIKKVKSKTIVLRDGEGNEVGTTTVTEFEMEEKKGALELLGRNLRMWTDKTELSGPGGGPIELTSDIERAARIAAILNAARKRAGGPAADGSGNAEVGTAAGTSD